VSESKVLREVMDVHDAAKYLGISHDTLYKYANDGFVPAFKLGNRWRFRRARLDEWMDKEAESEGVFARIRAIEKSEAKA
jgi:excisionase family DNA binding protein